MPFYKKAGWKNLGATTGTMAKHLDEFKKYVKAYGLKQDDLLIFVDVDPPPGKRPRDVILYMYDDEHASVSPRFAYDFPLHLGETLRSLGLTNRAAYKLWFPDNAYPLFTVEQLKP